MLAPDFDALDALIASTGRAKLELTPMTGGASTRRYVRVRFADEAGPPTAVAMFVPQRGTPEEIHKTRLATNRRWPYLEIADLLRARGFDVPAVYAEDTDRGWLLIEDLGDDTLAAHLARCPDEKTAFYKQAVADLARAQEAMSLDALPADSIVRTRAFDEDVLNWEIDLFREWVLDAAPPAGFDPLAASLARRIAQLPRGFVHRDYQSRNLMVRPNGRLAWIDFQDALLGPRVYDLAALLNDSYWSFERPFVEERIAEFADAARLTGAERADLHTHFDLVTVQRKLKDAGRFVFIDRVHGNASFLHRLDGVIARAKSALGRLAEHDREMRDFADLLNEVIPEGKQFY